MNGSLILPQRRGQASQTKASQRSCNGVLGAPGPSSDPSPWLRPTAANIYIFKVNSLEENLPGAGEAIPLWPVVTGPS